MLGDDDGRRLDQDLPTSAESGMLRPIDALDGKCSIAIIVQLSGEMNTLSRNLMSQEPRRPVGLQNVPRNESRDRSFCRTLYGKCAQGKPMVSQGLLDQAGSQPEAMHPIAERVARSHLHRVFVSHVVQQAQ